jgi:hypothetical protein
VRCREAGGGDSRRRGSNRLFLIKWLREGEGRGTVLLCLPKGRGYTSGERAGMMQACGAGMGQGGVGPTEIMDGADAVAVTTESVRACGGNSSHTCRRHFFREGEQDSLDLNPTV